jgi:Amt family ammonium transporter
MATDTTKWVSEGARRPGQARKEMTMFRPGSTTRERSTHRWLGLALATLLCAPAAALAEDAAPPTPAELAETLANQKMIMDTLWVMVAGFLVFFMNAGFALIEAGLCRAKNTSTILTKNFVVFAAATLAFWVLGFNLMFADGSSIVGGFALALMDGEKYGSLSWTTVPLAAKFFFQLVFAGTAATIVSGCVNERSKLWTFVVFSLVLTAVIYPISGHWIWGGGWLASMGFWDFAGSTVVHSVGGWAGLAGILVVGARAGRYKDGKVNAVPGHSMSLATLGALILWLGWFGFNPGSTMAADANGISHIAMTTNIAAAAGTLAATLAATLLLGKPDISMILNGCLAGLVAITAPCAWVTWGGACIIGAIGGVLAVLAVGLFDKLKIDDPVGALSVHLVNGIWGTLCVGLFAAPAFAGGEAQPGLGLFYGGGFSALTTQAIGVVAVGAYAFAASMLVWYVLKMTMGVRVTLEEETEGLDVHEIGVAAYNGDSLHKGSAAAPEQPVAAATAVVAMAK